MIEVWLHDLYAFLADSKAVFNSSCVASGTLKFKISECKKYWGDSRYLIVVACLNCKPNNFLMKFSVNNVFSLNQFIQVEYEFKLLKKVLSALLFHFVLRML